MCDIKLEDIGGESCEPVGGLTSKMLFCPHKDLSTIVDPPADLSGDFETLASITGPHVAVVGKGFVEFEGVDFTGTIKSTMVGEEGRRLYQTEATFQIAGSSKKIRGFLRAVKNLKFIAMVEEAGTGQLLQLGSKQLPARFSGIEHAIEAAMTGNNSVTLTIQDTQKWPAPVYSGAVPMKPAPEPEEG